MERLEERRIQKRITMTATPKSNATHNKQNVSTPPRWEGPIPACEVRDVLLDAIHILRAHGYNPIECLDAYGDRINPKFPGCVVFTLEGALTKALIDYDDKQPCDIDNHVERIDAVSRAVALSLPSAWEPEDESSRYTLTTIHRRQRASILRSTMAWNTVNARPYGCWSELSTTCR